jgi:hypothetical protein
MGDISYLCSRQLLRIHRLYKEGLHEMRSLFIMVMCLIILLLYGCALPALYLAAPRDHLTECIVEDSKTNRLEVMQVVRLIADRYGFQDRTEEERARDEQYGPDSSKAHGYTFIADYFMADSDKQSRDITFDVWAYEGKISATLSQIKWGKATKKYAEIQDRWVSEFKERFGARVDVKISDYKIP